MIRKIEMSNIIFGCECIGVSVGDSFLRIFEVLGKPDFIDVFSFSGDRNFVYKDLEFFVDGESEDISGIWIYSKGERGSFSFPELINSSDFIAKDVDIEEFRKFLYKKMNVVIINEFNDTKVVKIKNGEVRFMKSIGDKFKLYSIYLEKI